MQFPKQNWLRNLFLFLLAGICVEQIGTMLGVYIFTAYYLGLVQFSDSSDCGGTGKRKPDPIKRAAYRWHALTIGVLVVVCVFTTFITVREQKGTKIWCIR